MSILRSDPSRTSFAKRRGNGASVSSLGRTVWRWDSDPFGTSPALEDPDGDGIAFTYNLRFPGQYYDKETRLHYNYFRDYDRATGRYIQSDPIGLRGDRRNRLPQQSRRPTSEGI
jgi:RHS repeat-associated protein